MQEVRTLCKREVVLDLAADLSADDIAALDLSERTHDPCAPQLRHERCEQWLREPTAFERWVSAIGLVLCCISAMLVLGLAYYAAMGVVR